METQNNTAPTNDILSARASRTIEIPRETIAELMAKIGGHVQAPPVKRCNFSTELQDTQVLPAIEIDQPNQE
jgi:hypothetical protein